MAKPSLKQLQEELRRYKIANCRLKNLHTPLEVNGVSEGSVVAGSVVDVQLRNTTPLTVAPLAVTQVGNDLLIDLEDVSYDIYVNGVFNTTVTLPYGEANVLNITN